MWNWTPESEWYREVATVALRLALGQPGPACTSTDELIARLEGHRQSATGAGRSVPASRRLADQYDEDPQAWKARERAERDADRG